jgi:hypothetical protein
MPARRRIDGFAKNTEVMKGVVAFWIIRWPFAMYSAPAFLKALRPLGYRFFETVVFADVRVRGDVDQTWMI